MKTKRKANAAAPETVLVLRTCSANLKSYGGFQWPEGGPVEAPDWQPTAKCGHGLHGLLWGEGDGSLLDWSPDARWLVCRVEAATIVEIGNKVKFPRADVVHCGSQKSATEYIAAHGGAEKCITGGTATAGDRGTATAGDSGTATAGDRGTATAGDRGTATAGYRGVIAILHWNGKRYKTRIAQIKDEDGDGELEPNTPYRLNEKGEFVKAEKA